MQFRNTRRALCHLWLARSVIAHYLYALTLTTQKIGISDAYYCAACTRMEKDRDGCPKIINLGVSRKDLKYERRRLGTSVRFEHDARELTSLKY